MPHSEPVCGRYQQAMDLLGKRWTGLIIYVLLAGPRRYSEIAEQIESVSDRMLSERLKELETAEIIERRVYPDMPVRVEYRLTNKGQSLAPVIEAIQHWSHQWIAEQPAPVEQP